MNKRTKLVVSLLFAVLVILAAAVTRFYLGVPDGTDSKSNQAEIARRLESDESGNRIFEDGQGHFGVINSSDRIIVAPEWLELKFAGEGLCIAEKRIGGRTMFGCIDYEGSIAVPFIYSRITRRESGGYIFYTADADSDGSCVVYDSRFVPLFRQSWRSSSFDKGELVLKDDSGVYTYSVDSNGLLFKNASVSGESLGCGYELDISSRVLLSKLSVPMLEEIAGDLGKYIEFAYTGNDELLSDLTTGSRSGFQQLFPDDHKILTKQLLGISDIYIYSVKSGDDSPRYTVSAVCYTELTYSDETGETRSLRDGYTAAVEFSVSSEVDIAAVSGRFTLSEPEYPRPEPLADEPETAPASEDGAMSDAEESSGQ